MAPDEERSVTLVQLIATGERRTLWTTKGSAPAVNTGGQRVAIVDLDVTPTVFRIVDVDSRRILGETCKRPVGGGVWSPDGAEFACVSGGGPDDQWRLKTWDRDGKPLASLDVAYGTRVVSWAR